MEVKVKAKISGCILCAAVSAVSPTTQPLELSTLPPYPWHTTNIDFLGPLPNSRYLLVVINRSTFTLCRCQNRIISVR